MSEEQKDIRPPEAAYDVSEMAGANPAPTQHAHPQHHSAPPKRSGGLYFVVGMLVMVVLAQGAYIAYLQWGVKQAMNQVYAEVAASPLLKELGALDLNSLEGLGSLEGLEGLGSLEDLGNLDLGQLEGLEGLGDPNSLQLAPQPEGEQAPGGDGNEALPQQRLIDPNADVSVDQLLGLLQQLGGAYGEAFKMLEDPAYGVAPQPKQNPKPNDVIHPAYRVEETPVSYRVEIDMPDASAEAISVDTKDGALVVTAPIDGTKRYSQRVPLAAPIDAETLKTEFADGTLVINIRKATGGPVTPAVAA